MIGLGADIVIIGAGVVGCAIARTLKKNFPNKKIFVLEKNEGPGLETSQHNSGVIHSGLHLNPKSLKARFARNGSRKVIDYCEDFSVPYEKTGMLVVSAFKDILNPLNCLYQLQALRVLYRRANEQNIPIDFLLPHQIKGIEPVIRGLAGIFVPEVHIIDAKSFTRKLCEEAKSLGVQFFFNEEVKSIAKSEKLRPSRYRVRTNKSVFWPLVVINAAGVNADLVAKMAGFNYQVYFYSGEYYEVVSDKKNNILGTLVYPATKPGKPGLGIHITKKTDGRVFLGPNAKLCGRDIDSIEKTPPEIFVKAIKPFWPEIRANDLEWAYSGVRTKVVEKGEGDFVIKMDARNPATINLVGIESPGLTASLSIAEYVLFLIRTTLY